MSKINNFSISDAFLYVLMKLSIIEKVKTLSDEWYTLGAAIHRHLDRERV